MSSLLVLSWTAVFTSDYFLAKSYLLLGLCFVGLIFGLSWAVLGWRSSDFVGAYHHMAEAMENSAENQYWKPFVKGASIRNKVRDNYWLKLTSSRALVTVLPLVLAVLFLCLSALSGLSYRSEGQESNISSTNIRNQSYEVSTGETEEAKLLSNTFGDSTTGVVKPRADDTAAELERTRSLPPSKGLILDALSSGTYTESRSPASSTAFFFVNWQDWIHNAILVITAIILYWTGKAMHAQYKLAARPRVGFALDWRDPNNPRHMYLTLSNQSLSDAKALVVVRLLVDEQPLSLGDKAYCGKQLWNVAVGQRVTGHKNIKKLIGESPNWEQSELALEITVCYREWSRRKRRLVGETFHILKQRWELIKGPEKNTKRFIPVITSREEEPDFNCTDETQS